MNAADFLQHLQRDPDLRGRIVHVEQLPPREAKYAEPQAPLDPRLRHALRMQGINRLYSHQAAALDAVHDGRDVVIVSGTASGKTLCYNIPVLERLLADPDARAIYLFPTKALARDQLDSIRHLASPVPEFDGLVVAEAYDGDTPASQRAKIRSSARILITNPDMLHQSILSYHPKWMRFLQALRTVVIDEVHSYRGVFGSHVACVLRRLRRVCDHYAVENQVRFIACSASIANPRDHTSRLIGRPVDVVENDGSPRGPKHLVFWNPPPLESNSAYRSSPNVEAERLMMRLMSQGSKTIVFAHARITAELVFRDLKRRLRHFAPGLSQRLGVYRSGYLPKDRRAVERQLFDGQLLGVCATSALELGIDVGYLDAAVILGFPGTVCSLWQQAGRVGRKSADSIVFLVAYNDPIDQYLMRHPEYLLGLPHEQALIDPHNRHILAAHLRCAAAEIRIDSKNHSWLGDNVLQMIPEMAAKPEPGTTWWQDAQTGDWHVIPAGGGLPHHKTVLRHLGQTTYAITEKRDDRRNVIGTVDSDSAPILVHPHAVYLHGGDTYLVRELDEDAHEAVVERREVDYYTQPIVHGHCQVIASRESEPWRGGVRSFGDVEVTWQTIGFKKIKYYTMELIGQEAVELQPRTIRTHGMWLQPPQELLDALLAGGHKPAEALLALRNVMLVVLPFVVMADRQDVSGQVDVTHPGAPAVFIYDRFHGGVGYARAGYDRLDDLLAMSRALVEECACAEGCPSCVGSIGGRAARRIGFDADGGFLLPGKAAVKLMLQHWLESE